MTGQRYLGKQMEAMKYLVDKLEVLKLLGIQWVTRLEDSLLY